MAHNDIGDRLVFGALAGLVGTLVLQSLRSTRRKGAPEALPGAVQGRIPDKAESLVGQALGMGYGMSFGALYGAMEPPNEPTTTDGVLLGLATWTAGYLGWLPATGLMSHVRHQKQKQLWPPIAEHAIYGVATVLGYHWLKRLFASETKF